MNRFESRVALITGVILVDRNDDLLTSAAAELGDRAEAVTCDVADHAGIAAVINDVGARYGRIDVLVAAAGVDQCDTVPGTTIEQWRTIIDVDLDGVFYACRAAIPVMAARGSGAIVTISSAIGTVGERNRSAYCAAKAGVENLTRAMALEHGREGIRANCVAPGLIDTPLIRGGKVGGGANPAAMQAMVDAHHVIPGSASPRRSPPPSRSWPATTPPSSPAPSSPSTPAGPPPEVCTSAPGF